MKSKKKSRGKATTKFKIGAVRRKPTKKPKPVSLRKKPKELAKLKLAQMGIDAKLAARLAAGGMGLVSRLDSLSNAAARKLQGGTLVDFMRILQGPASRRSKKKSASKAATKSKTGVARRKLSAKTKTVPLARNPEQFAKLKLAQMGVDKKSAARLATTGMNLLSRIDSLPDTAARKSMAATLMDLMRIFPGPVAMAFAQAKVRSVGELKSWTVKKFTTTLRAAGLSGRCLSAELERCLRTQAELNKRPAKSICGLRIDLGKRWPLKPRADLAKLTKANVYTLGDWVRKRGELKLAKANAKLLDAHASLSTMHATFAERAALIRAGVYSPQDLTLLDRKALKKLAGQMSISSVQLQDLTFQAASAVFQAQHLINNTMLYSYAGMPSWWTGAGEGDCDCCPEDESRISRYAYFVYLVITSKLTIAALDARLQQDFATLTATNGLAQVPQIDLCVRALARAFPGPITFAENFFYMRRMVGGFLTVVDIAPLEIAEALEPFLPGLVLDEFSRRLQETVVAPLFSPIPSFTEQELELAGMWLEDQATEVEKARLLNSPGGSGLTPAELTAAARLKVLETLEPLRRSAWVARRKVFKDRSGLSDVALQERFCMEMDLEPCLLTTRLNQAIASMQSLLDGLSPNAPEAVGYSPYDEFTYLSYEQWRANELASLYPELRALMRDDPLTGEDDAWDRGSILHRRAETRPALTLKLNEAEAALKKAKLSDDRNFEDTVYAAYFDKGFRAIRRVLEADDRVQDAMQALDEDEPGLALAKLNDAEAKLAEMADLVFLPGSLWRNPDQIRAEKLVKLKPWDRWVRMVTLFSELASGRKDLFEIGESLLVIHGLNRITGLFESISNWELGTGFRLATPDDGLDRGGTIMKDGNLESSATNYKRCYYRDGETFGDCKWSVGIELIDGLSLNHPTTWASKEVVGLILHIGVDSEYQLIIKSEYTDPPDASGTWSHFLVLAKKASGTGAELARSHALSLFRQGDRLTLSLRYAERKLTGEMFWSGDPIVLEYTDTPGAALSSGTVGLIASRTLSAAFGPAYFEFLAVHSAGLPPFYALPVADDGIYRPKGTDYYRRHMQIGSGFAADVPTDALVYKVDVETRRELVGTPGPLRIVFAAEENAVSTDLLHELLDKMVSLSHHLRFVVLPIRRAQAHLRAGAFAQAVDMLHLVYDERSGENPLLANGICGYLTNPPLAFTATRSHDVRLMHLRLGEAYLAWADWLFRQNTDETRAESRKYLRRVLALHDANAFCKCGAEVADAISWVSSVLVQHIQLAYGNDEQLALLLGAVRDILEALAALYDKCVDVGDVQTIVNSVLAVPPTDAATLLAALQQAASDLRAVPTHTSSVTGPIVGSGVVDAAAAAIEAAIAAAVLALLEFLGLGPGTYAPSDPDSSYSATGLHPLLLNLCAPSNPLTSRQKRQACFLLDRLRSCRNILGFEGSEVPPQRFETLLRLARSLADLAVAAERDLLNFRQLFESESYSLLQANNQLDLTAATITLEQMKAQESASEIQLAALQLGQSQMSSRHYETLIANGLSDMETLALGSAVVAASFQSLAALPALAGIALAGGGLALTVGSGGAAAPAAAPAAVLGAAISLTSALTGGLGALGSAATSISNAASIAASYERREEEWNYQLGLARWNIAISQQNVTLAVERYQIAQQQVRIAQLQHDFARDAVQFLGNKFLNRAMLVWMQRTIRDEYRTRLNYAITAGYLAERALASELQTELKKIRFDYDDPRHDGLLGATQLVTALAELEQTKITAPRPNIADTKIISLARFMPIELIQLRQTGSISFSTLLSWFDDGFQGHYLRRIKSVRVSILAIVPPIDGIHAMLCNGGGSTIVTRENGRFETKRIVSGATGPIALHNAFNDNGLFVLNYDDPMLLPFEGLGVETQWTLELPRANNRFDFQTIADVLLTIDYTAEYSREYQVIQRAERAIEDVFEDVSVPLRFAFPDLWYHLNNHRKDPSGAFPAFQFKFHLPRVAVAPNLADPITVAHLTMLVSGNFDATERSDVADGFTIISNGTVLHSGVVPRPPPPPPGIPGDPTSAFGNPVPGANSFLLSTRANSAIGLPSNPQIGTATPDEWIVEFAPWLFPTLIEKISDVLLVITVTGRRFNSTP